MKFFTEPKGLNMFIWLFAIRDEDGALFSVNYNPFPAQLIEQVGSAFEFNSSIGYTRHSRNKFHSALICTKVGVSHRLDVGLPMLDAL